MLRKIRITLSSIFFIGITLLFLDVTGCIHLWLGWMAKIQFLPAVLSLNLLVIAALVIITLIFGRVYCSVICPLGVMQDIISWAHTKVHKRFRYRFKYTKERKWLRYGMLALFILSLILGIHAIVGILAPYSSFGRIAENIFAPIYGLGNNVLAWIAGKFDSYAFYSTDVWIKSTPTFVVAGIMFILLSILAWHSGREWCNSICPVGTILGFFSRFSIFAIKIDSSKCRHCGLCGRGCKASCIDMDKHIADSSRCVACMDCIDNCREGAITYGFRYKNKATTDKLNNHSEDKTNIGRRAFLVSSAIIGATALKAQEEQLKQRLAPVRKHQMTERQNRIVPAGAISIKNFEQHCTACQLCVNTCPNDVLRPSSKIKNLMQPEMAFEKGYCRPECTKCSEVCPTGAIIKITLEEKTSIQIGHAVVNLDLCVVNTDGVKCGNCAKHCPSGAIRMVPSIPSDPHSPRIPSVNEENCIGCGACENLCPASPIPAIHVEGHLVHRTI